MAAAHWPLDASVIVCTRNRAAALRQTLAALSAMCVPDTVRHEVIVIDNASSDDTRSVVEAAAAGMPVSYCYEGQPGAGHARNTGLAQAMGRLIFVTDDDCVVSPDWLETGIRLLTDNPRQVIGGRVELHDPRDLPITIKTETKPTQLATVISVFGFIHGCNMILGRCVLDEVGLFDPLLGPGTRCRAADDADLVYRAFRAGVPVRYAPELRVAHDHGRRDKADGARLMRGYMVSKGAMACKHLLGGRLDLLKPMYWDLRANARDRGPRLLPDYLAGALAYLRSLREHGEPPTTSSSARSKQASVGPGVRSAG